MLKCLCGHKKFSEFHRPTYEVDSAGVTARAEGKSMILGQCSQCGIVRQVELPFQTEQDFKDYYKNEYPPVTKNYTAKDYRHDLGLAKTRCADYGISLGYQGRVLDVGSGSGAFVEEARTKGANAYGCEIGKYHYAGQADEQFVYRQRFEDVNFPTDYFDLTVCHDVLEHVLDPARFASELFRVTQQLGDCIVDFPRFFHDAGKHHWKRFEHLWFLTPEQLETLFTQVGFQVFSVSHPIESKVLFRLKKPQQTRPTILVPPGIGDSFWSVVKMQSFLKREKLGLPDISVVCPRSKAHDGHKRSFLFLEMFPFLKSTGISIEGKSSILRPIWTEAYMQAGRTIFRGVDKFDYFMAYNGHLRIGKSLNAVDPDLKCNWFPPMFRSLEQEKFKDSFVDQHGKYLVFYFPFQGTYKYWTDQFSVANVISFVTRLSKDLRYTPVFTGAAWDAENDILNHVKTQVPACVDMVGKTSVEELFGLIRGSQGVIGYPSGLTILSTVLQQKTMIIWNDFYSRKFVRHSCPPSTWNKTYFAENTLNLTPDYLTAWAIEKISGKRCNVKRGFLGKQLALADLSSGADSAEVFVPKSTLSNRLISMKRYTPSDSVTIACVLKTGSYFDKRYVINLKNMLTRNLSSPFKFVCLTDLPIIKGVETIPLVDNLPGWWSKIELFRPGIMDSERILYFDLDTVIVKNIDDMLAIDGDFYGLRPWNEKNRMNGQCASGIMAWHNGACDFFYTDFTKQIIERDKGDQVFISASLKHHEMTYQPIQDEVTGIYSYKRECRNRLPQDARIVCFHGRPRVHEVADAWVVGAWR